MPGATQARLSARNGRRHQHVGVANLRALELKPEDTLRVFQRSGSRRFLPPSLPTVSLFWPDQRACTGAPSTEGEGR